MISLFSYKDRTKKSSMDSMKSYDPCMKRKKLQPEFLVVFMLTLLGKKS